MRTPISAGYLACRAKHHLPQADKRSKTSHPAGSETRPLCQPVTGGVIVSRVLRRDNDQINAGHPPLSGDIQVLAPCEVPMGSAQRNSHLNPTHLSHTRLVKMAFDPGNTSPELNGQAYILLTRLVFQFQMGDLVVMAFLGKGSIWYCL